MHKLLINTVFLILLSLFMTVPASGAQIWQSGFRTIGSWLLSQNLRVDLNIWYPSLRQPQELNFSPWRLQGALNAKPVSGSFPLIVISHPTPGNRYSYAGLCSWLASKGYIVVAPTHSRDCLDNMNDLFTWQQLENRTKEISHAIDVVTTDPNFSSIIDSGRIGLIGFGAGASAALLLGGALPNCAQWSSYCTTAGASDPYCTLLAKDKIEQTCANFPLQKSMANPRIKAIVAVAPGFGFFFNADSFKYFYPPLLLVTTKLDLFNNPILHSEALARILGEKAYYLTLPQADTAALMDECSSALAEELPELCASVSSQTRQEIRSTLENSLFSFFNHYLLQNLPDIPPPPDFTSPPPKEQTKPKSTDKKGRRR